MAENTIVGRITIVNKYHNRSLKSQLLAKVVTIYHLNSGYNFTLIDKTTIVAIFFVPKNAIMKIYSTKSNNLRFYLRKKIKKFRTDHKNPRLRGRRLNFQWLSTSIQIQLILLFCFPDNIIYSNSFFLPPNNHSIILNIYSKHSHSDRNKNHCKNCIYKHFENI